MKWNCAAVAVCITNAASILRLPSSISLIPCSTLAALSSARRLGLSTPLSLSKPSVSFLGSNHAA